MANSRLEFYRNSVLARTGVSLQEFVSKSRRRSAVEARQAFFLIAYTNVKCTYSEIGQYAGGRDHSTAIYGIATMKDLIFSNPKKFAWVKEIIEEGDSINVRVEYNISKAVVMCERARIFLNKNDILGAYKALRAAINELAAPEITDELLTLAADQKIFEEVNG